jgi:hypothetical protein
MVTAKQLDNSLYVKYLNAYYAGKTKAKRDNTNDTMDQSQKKMNAQDPAHQ